MKDWRRVLWSVGMMWFVTWGFAVAGWHTPMSLAVTLVGVTGTALMWACIWDYLSSERH